MPPRRRRICCVPNCVQNKKETEVKFIKFPDDKKLQKKWILQVGCGASFQPAENSRVCSKHFTSGRRTYTPSSVDYVPSLFPSKSKIQSVTMGGFCAICRRKVCKCEKVEQKVICVTRTETNEKCSSSTLDGCTSAQETTNNHREVQTPSSENIMDSIPNQMDNENVESDPCTVVSSTEPEPDIQSGEVILDFRIVDETEKETIKIAELQIPKDVIQIQASKAQTINKENSALEEPPTPVTDVIQNNPVIEVVSKSDKGQDECEDNAIPISETTDAELNSSVVPCFLDNCDRDSSTSGVEMYPFPTIQRVRRKWAVLLRLGKYAEIPRDAHLCSWHFLDGPHKCPSRFHWNEAKNFALNFPNSVKKRRRQDANPGPQPSQPDVFDLEDEPPTRPRKQYCKPELEESDTDEDEFSDYSKDDLKNKIKKLQAKNKHLTMRQKNSENESGTSESARKSKKEKMSALAEAQLHLQQCQDRWAKEKKMILEANAALAYQVQKERQAKTALEEKIKGPTFQAALKQNLRFDNCIKNFKYFTGLPSTNDFDQLFKCLKAMSKGMKHWDGNLWLPASEEPSQPQPYPKKGNRIDNRNQLFLTLCRYKRGFSTKELGFFFGVDPGFIASIFTTFSKLIESELEKLYLKSRLLEFQNDQKSDADTISKNYPKLFAVLRSAEIHFDFRCSVLTHKAKKRKVSPVFKVIFLFSTTGDIFFISNVFRGEMTVEQIAHESGVLDILPPGSELLVEQEFQITDKCTEKDILLRKTSLDPYHILEENDSWETELLISCRMRASELIRSIKLYRIFQNELISSRSPFIIHTALVIQNYIDTKCTDVEVSIPSASSSAMNGTKD